MGGRVGTSSTAPGSRLLVDGQSVSVLAHREHPRGFQCAPRFRPGRPTFERPVRAVRVHTLVRSFIESFSHCVRSVKQLHVGITTPLLDMSF